jgi:phosphoribosylaminoimidazolecarboxamide formyltransferase/IMP cyclohydrolase
MSLWGYMNKGRPMATPERCALLSVYDKTGITEFAGALVKLGWRIYSSGGTAQALLKAEIPVTDVSDLVGEAILGHRVVTLSREIHAGLLARPGIKEDRAELRRLGVPLIDLVCVDLYPLEAEVAKPDATEASVTEATDIGGPTLMRSGAKGRRIVISHPEQRPEVLQWLSEGEPNPEAFRQALAARAEATVADYCLASARYHSLGRFDGLVGEAVTALKYGENAAQTPAHFLSVRSADPLALERFTLVGGTDPSYTNLTEVSRHLQTLTHLAAGLERNTGRVPHLALGTKHGNPCGAAAGDDPADVIRRMVMGDPRAIFGGIVSVNFEFTADLAEELLRHGMMKGRRLLDMVIAPGFTPDAIQLMSRKGDRCRFLVNPALASLSAASLDTTPVWRQVRGGFLRQPNFTYVLDLASSVVNQVGDLTDGQKADLVIAWAICATSNSNTITLVKDRALIGNGVGQQDRVGCCELAIKRATDAGHEVEGAVAASDSFFPFPDGPEVLIAAGVSAIWATSGSVKDGDTQELCKQKGVALWQAPDTVARGFFGH